MTMNDQLEVIHPDGQIEFYTLDPAQGVTNVGRDQNNDVVLDAPDVAPFHAVIDHRQRPYHVMLLSEAGETRLGGQPISSNAAIPLTTWDALEVAGHTLILIEGEGAPSRTPTTPPPVEQRDTPATPSTALAPTRAAPVVSRTAIRPSDQTDEIILVELSEREWTVDVEQQATFTVTVANGGPIVATFGIRVEGIDPAWIEVLPARLNLNEGERGTAVVTITPPRRPSSRAGAHHLGVVVESADYPGHTALSGATLVVNPYTEFAIGELSPRQQTVGGRHPTGEAVVQIANKGNDDAIYRLEALDDERACSFEFRVPGESINLARQAEIRLPPEETHAIPVLITPLNRPLVGLRSRRHAYTVTATALEGQQTPRSLLGEIRVRPLIGPFWLLLGALLTAALVLLLFRPSIGQYQAEAGDLTILPGEIVAIRPGEPVTFAWRAPWFSRAWISVQYAEGGETILTLPEHRGRREETPLRDADYVLNVASFLSDLLWFVQPVRETITVDVVPLQPLITQFTADPEQVLVGEFVTLSWVVQNADGVYMEVSSAGASRRLDLEPGQRERGSMRFSPSASTTYTLVAYAGDASVSRPLSVDVRLPPLPTPIIQRFSVFPLQVTQGQTVTLEWGVQGATDVAIQPLGDGFPAQYTTIHAPPGVGSFTYQLLAFLREGDRQSDPVRSEPITVMILPPTPEPEAPTINYFRLVPEQVLRGGTVELTWSVTGATNVEITGPTLGTVSNLVALGSLSVAAEATTFFVLTAYNGDLTASAMAQLTVLEPTPTPVPTPTPLPLPNIVQFEARGLTASDQVNLVDQTADTMFYSVPPRTRVRLRWVVFNSAMVSLFRNDTALGQRLPEGEYEDLQAIVLQPVIYRLTAVNADGAGTVRYIQVSPLDLKAPPPPFNVSGYTSGERVVVTWQYDPLHWGLNPADVYPITGFVVYRAGPPYVVFAPRADETTLNNTTCSPFCQWEETPDRICEYAYYVTAVYLDRIGDRQETAPSEERYYTGPCPTPTPTPVP